MPNYTGKQIELDGLTWTIQGPAPKSGRFHASRFDDDMGRTVWIEVRVKRGTFNDWEEARG